VKYAFVDDERDFYSVTTLCRVLGVSRRGYYDWVDRPDSARVQANQRLLIEIHRVFMENREVYGAPRIHRELNETGHPCGLNRVARLMQKAGIVPKTVRKFRITTDSRKSHKPADNVLNQEFSATRRNEKWVADVTYIPTREGWLFLAAVLDLYARKIVGWSMHDRLTAQLAAQALKNALAQEGKVEGLLHHSDRGKEYYANEYQKLLKEHDIVCSMSRKGNCYDNAVMESFFHSLKVELVHHEDFYTRSEARAAIFDYIEVFYNRKRRHSSINYQSPLEYEKQYA
jgi:transposase InsO family protein